MYQPLVSMDHFLQRGAEILQIPLQDQRDLDADETGQNEAVGLQLGGIEDMLDDGLLFPQEADTLIHQQRQQIVPDDDVKEVLFFLPEGKIECDDLFF